MKKKLNYSDKSWYPYTVATCAAVALYVALTHLNLVFQFIAMIGNFIYPIIAGAVIAYLMNPLMMWFRRKVFYRIENIELRRKLSLAAAVGVVALAIVFLLLTLLPQLVSSITTFLGNFDSYVQGLGAMLQKSSADENAQDMLERLRDFVDSLTKSLAQNSGGIFSAASSVGSHVGAWAIGFMLAVYFLAGKEKIKVSAKKLCKSLLRESYDEWMVFFTKCNDILSRYIIFSMIDAVIIGVVNALFMAVTGIPFVGLISVVVGVTNLIPTFGPIIGAIIGCFIILLVNPKKMILFLIFTLVLQFFDGYILKPKMFGDTFGVSGLWIMIAIIVGGRMFGVIGILLAIPAVAIISMVFEERISPEFNKRQAEESGDSKKSDV